MAEPFRDVTRAAGEQTGASLAPIVRAWEEHEGRRPMWMADGVHPTEEGYEAMARAVLEAILED